MHSQAKKFVFLDVDGVLNGKGEDAAICAKRVKRLSNIINQTGAKIIVSSSWRGFPGKMIQLKQALSKEGLEVEGATGTEDFFSPQLAIQREHEIRKKAKELGAEKFVVIDDMRMNFENQCHTDECAGIQESDVARAIQLLK